MRFSLTLTGLDAYQLAAVVAGCRAGNVPVALPPEAREELARVPGVALSPPVRTSTPARGTVETLPEA
jgi:hypothetical protein